PTTAAAFPQEASYATAHNHWRTCGSRSCWAAAMAHVADEQGRAPGARLKEYQYQTATAWALLAKELVDDGMFHLHIHADRIAIQEHGHTNPRSWASLCGLAWCLSLDLDLRDACLGEANLL